MSKCTSYAEVSRYRLLSSFGYSRFIFVQGLAGLYHYQSCFPAHMHPDDSIFCLLDMEHFSHHVLILRPA